MNRESGFYYPIFIGFVSIMLFLIISELSDIKHQRELEWWNNERIQVANAVESAFHLWQIENEEIPESGKLQTTWDRFQIQIEWITEEDGKKQVTVEAVGERRVKKRRQFTIDPMN